MSITPLNDRVLVKRFEDEEEVVNGLVRPDIAKEKPASGLVIAVGTGKNQGAAWVPLDVQVGDKVYFGKYSGAEIKIDGEDLLVLREEDIYVKE
jgi:chaperonin GroES